MEIFYESERILIKSELGRQSKMHVWDTSQKLQMRRPLELQLEKREDAFYLQMGDDEPRLVADSPLLKQQPVELFPYEGARVTLQFPSYPVISDSELRMIHFKEERLVPPPEKWPLIAAFLLVGLLSVGLFQFRTEIMDVISAYQVPPIRESVDVSIGKVPKLVLLLINSGLKQKPRLFPHNARPHTHSPNHTAETGGSEGAARKGRVGKQGRGRGGSGKKGWASASGTKKSGSGDPAARRAKHSARS